MSDTVDREVQDTKEETLGASMAGTKVSSVRLEDESGKLLSARIAFILKVL